MSFDAPVLELKPLSHNPFLDGTIVYDNLGGDIVPYTAGGAIDPIASGASQLPRPTRASTEGLVDAAQKAYKIPVTNNPLNPVGYDLPRGLRDGGVPFDIDDWEKGLSGRSADQLEDLTDGLLGMAARGGSDAAATAARSNLRNMARAGSEVLGVAGLAFDAYNLADAILDPTNQPHDEIGEFIGASLGGFAGSAFGPLGTIAGGIVGGLLGRAIGNALGGDGYSTTTPAYGPAPFSGGQCPTRYTVNYSLNDPNFGSINGSSQVWGPISAPSIVPGASIGQDPYWYFLYAPGGIIPPGNAGAGARDTFKVQTSQPVFRGTPPSLASFSPSRNDGGADNCGDPLGDSAPVATRPTYPDVRTRNPDFPRPDIPGLDTPEPIFGPNPRIPDLDLPELGPGGDPANRRNPQGGDGIDSPPSPDDLPDGGGGGAGGGGGGANPNPELDCCGKIDAIYNYFQVSGQGAWDAALCGEEMRTETWGGAGLFGLYRAVEALTMAVGQIWLKLRCLESGAAIPEWWAVRPGANVPQLVITLKDVEGNSYWSLSIPHYFKNQDYKPQLPKFTKGAYFSTLTLLDNTKVVVNAKSFNEGERVILAILPLIDPAFLPAAPDIHQGRRKGKELKIVEVAPIRAAFYANGQASPVPDFYPEIKAI